jgi:site-specific recombinase XerD
MASLYKRDKSPFWWVKFKDETGTRRESTKYRIGNRSDRNKALDYKAQLAAKEPKSIHSAKRERFEDWVESYIALRYSGATLARVRLAWRRIHAFLKARSISDARQVTRKDCLDYMTARKSTAMVSTAVTEMRYFSAIMSEALRRGMRSDNPCHKLGVKAPKPEPKKEITDEEIAFIRREIERSGQNKELLAIFRKLKATDDWNPQQFLEGSFEIAIHQGCRLSETLIDLHRDVDLENEEISFHAKGDKFYTTSLHPDLKAIVAAWRTEGRRMSYRIPAMDPTEWRKLASFYWSKFFHHIGLPHLSFHCTRVTVISRLHRTGVPESIAMKLVNHSSSVVHQIYKRTKKEQLTGLWPTMGGAEKAAP